MTASDVPQAGAPARIFLSHKTADKAAVREYKLTLELLGLRPWLDEDDLHAGAEVHREILRGMQESCAAVFFITADYKDEKFLRAEVNYAIAEKTKRGDSFSIITLVLASSDRKVGTVPELLEPYVWKTPKTPLEGLREIIRALPPPFRDIRPAVELTTQPRVRVTVSSGRLVTQGPKGRSDEVVLVRIENHGGPTLYLTGGVSFDRDDTDLFGLVMQDAAGMWPTPKQLAPGDALQIPIAKGDLRSEAAHIAHFFFQDQLGRRFQTADGEAQKALKDSTEG